MVHGGGNIPIPRGHWKVLDSVPPMLSDWDIAPSPRNPGAITVRHGNKMKRTCNVLMKESKHNMNLSYHIHANIFIRYKTKNIKYYIHTYIYIYIISCNLWTNPICVSICVCVSLSPKRVQSTNINFLCFRMHNNIHLRLSMTHMGVSASILTGFSLINHPFWGNPISWKHPYKRIFKPKNIKKHGGLFVHRPLESFLERPGFWSPPKKGLSEGSKTKTG